MEHFTTIFVAKTLMSSEKGCILSLRDSVLSYLALVLLPCYDLVPVTDDPVCSGLPLEDSLLVFTIHMDLPVRSVESLFSRVSRIKTIL